jgi:hypothetical protein
MPEWKPIGKYTIQLPEIPPPSMLPHALGYIPAYCGKPVPPPKEKPVPIPSLRWKDLRLAK